MVQYGRHSRSFWARSLRSSFGRTIMGKAIWESPIETWMGGKFQIGECLFVHREKGLFLSVYVDDVKLGWKETKPWSDVESTQQRTRFGGEPTSFVDHVYLGLHSKTMWNKQRYCGQLQSHVWIANFRGGREQKKLLYTENFRISSWSCDMEGHAKKCVERYCELVNKTTQQLLQSIYSMHRWPPL